MIPRILLLVLILTPILEAAPPFSGTIFIDPDIITSRDPTTYVRARYAGKERRSMFDRRRNAWVRRQAHLFKVTFKDSATVTVQVNTEFGSPRSARKVAVEYAREVGRLPRILKSNVRTITIHKGTRPFGGGSRDILVHTGQGVIYRRGGILEETLVHEASHTSLDAKHARSTRWRAAQASDPEFISTYARDNPTREDIAESFLPWMAVRLRPERIDPALADQIKAAIPARLLYFDSQRFPMSPVK